MLVMESSLKSFTVKELIQVRNHRNTNGFVTFGLSLGSDRFEETLVTDVRRCFKPVTDFSKTSINLKRGLGLNETSSEADVGETVVFL